MGFDRLFELLENGLTLLPADNYPPFDIENDGGDHYRITLAVAGFRQDEIDITAKQNVLVISGRKSDEEGRNYVMRPVPALGGDGGTGTRVALQVAGAERLPQPPCALSAPLLRRR